MLRRLHSITIAISSTGHAEIAPPELAETEVDAFVAIQIYQKKKAAEDHREWEASLKRGKAK